MKEKRWFSQGPDKLRDEMMREARKDGMDKEAAQIWVYSELDRLYPPQAAGETKDIPSSEAQRAALIAETEGVRYILSGLSDITSGWGALSANSTLAAEIA